MPRISGYLTTSHEIDKMKIAIVINTTWNIYNFRLGLIKGLQKKGHEIIAIGPRDDYAQKLIEEGCQFAHLPIEATGVNPLTDLLLIRSFYRLYKKVKPDVVLHYTIKPNIYGAVAARFLSIPSVNNVSGLGTVFLNNNLSSKIAQFLYRFAFKFPIKVFFQNEYDIDLFIKKKLVKRGITGVLPGSGIDLKKFTPAVFSRNEPFKFLMVSRVIIDKGILEYIDAAKELRKSGLNAEFLLLGAKDPDHKRGIPLRDIDSWTDSGLIKYLGTTDDVKREIRSADCIVLPSYREGTPRTLLEAAACGKPLLASNVPGCNNVVIDGINGLLCEVKNAKDLAKKMDAIMQFDEVTLKKFGENSRMLVEEKFDEQIVVQKYLTVIDSIK